MSLMATVHNAPDSELRSVNSGGCSALQTGLILLLLFVLRIPFYLTHYIQEDAYIIFRTAFHLADYGTYSYNLGEHTPGVTSTLYGLVVAVLRKIFGRWAIDSVLVFDTLAFLLGALLLSRVFFRDSARQLAFLVLISTCPVAMEISSRGMEIPLQVLAIAWIAYTLRDGKPSPQTLMGLFLLPLIRPDAVAYALLFTLLSFSFHRMYGGLALLATFGGSIIVLVFNKMVSGHFLTSTIYAKNLSYHPNRSLYPVLDRLLNMFIKGSYLTPLSNNVVGRIGFLFAMLLIGCSFIAIHGSRRCDIRFRLFLVLFACGILIPACYAYGGFAFPWYLWTSDWLMTLFGCYVLIVWLARMNCWRFWLTSMATVIVWIGLYTGAWLIAMNNGLQSYYYTADIGRYIHRIASPHDSLLLEPAGYIPFYAEIYSADEIGLTSEIVLNYRVRYGADWYVHYLKEQHPTFLVERNNILCRRSVDNAQFSPEEWAWFTAHYTQIAHEHYNAENYTHSQLFLRLAKSVISQDLNVFKSNGLP